ncbi:MAG TPA: transglutaminase-like domain-containing protein [Rhizomicrobium sp.]|jgi:regulator of sirC expression with transglutaminase-like and TPR domain|nr:transglutaminase-like domain-containing protein [Rhizomicrobium sp.]
MSNTRLAYLQSIGEAGDGPHDIARVALMLASLDQPQRSLEPFQAHLLEIAEAMQAGKGLIRRVADGAELLSTLFVERYGYQGDRLTYDDPRNADLMAVIERRRGLPVSLGILYMHAARAAGMTASGLNTQGHFVIRIAHRHDDLTLDPFNGGVVLDSGDVPTVLRDTALAEPVSDIDVLLRLQNNLKIRALDAKEHERALELASRMALIAPRRPDVWFELARINEAVGVLGAARLAYETCLGLVATGQALHNEAVLSLANLKRRLN